jgi:hypothetical protein
MCAQVWLCRERKTGKVVALKKLRKAEMVRRGQVGDRSTPHPSCRPEGC